MTIELVEEKKEHPWGPKAAPGKWETRHYSAETHMEAGKAAWKMMEEGWSVWLISNTGSPGFVVYRKERQ